jgi:hypothetical protein
MNNGHLTENSILKVSHYLSSICPDVFVAVVGLQKKCVLFRTHFLLRRRKKLGKQTKLDFLMTFLEKAFG